jgi:hypothetical protein
VFEGEIVHQGKPPEEDSEPIHPTPAERGDYGRAPMEVPEYESFEWDYEMPEFDAEVADGREPRPFPFLQEIKIQNEEDSLSGFITGATIVVGAVLGVTYLCFNKRKQN